MKGIKKLRIGEPMFTTEIACKKAGILFKLLRIDLLRLKNKKDTYWLDIEESENRIRKQY